MFIKFIKQIATLLKGSPEIQQQAAVGVTNKILIHAVRTNDTKLVTSLLNEGADPNGFGTLGETALTCAAKNNNTEMIRLLLDNGANVNGVEHTWLCIRPLGEAALANATEAAKMLIENGAEMNIRDTLHSKTDPTQNETVA